MTDAVKKALQPIPLHGMLFDVAGASAQGPRAENQDAFDVDAFATRGLVAVADGMGGERAGRLAADTALQSLAGGGEIRSLDAARYAVRYADEAVARLAQEAPDARGGMGCALALMALTVDRGGEVGWIGAHVGDVRILSRSPDGTVRLETRDHTPAYARWEAGEIALDEIPDSPGSNKLQRAVGRGGEADARWIPVRPGWTFLLISDGVTKTMRLDELGHAMTLPSSQAICDAVTRKVEERGPDDNYTIVAVRVLDGEGGATLPDPGPRRSLFDSAAAPPPPADAHRPHATSTTVGGGHASAAPRNLINSPEDPDVNGRRGGGIASLLLALLALALAGYAAWAASQQGGADPALSARVDSLRAEVASMRAAAVPVDTTADSLAARDSAAIGPITQPTTPAGPAGGAAAPPSRTTPQNRTTTP